MDGNPVPAEPAHRSDAPGINHRLCYDRLNPGSFGVRKVWPASQVRGFELSPRKLHAQVAQMEAALGRSPMS